MFRSAVVQVVVALQPPMASQNVPYRDIVRYVLSRQDVGQTLPVSPCAVNDSTNAETTSRMASASVRVPS